MAEYRLRFGKLNNLRYLSHLNLMKAMERAIRRAGLPLAFSEGFHPHPKISFGPALAVGIESTAEYMDLELTAALDAGLISGALNRVLPPGLCIYETKPLPPGTQSLNAFINKASYVILLRVRQPDLKAELQRAVERILQATELIVTRTGKDGQKRVNIRPWLHNLTIEEKTDDMMEIRFVGQIGSNGNFRPEDMLTVLAQPVTVLAIVRNGLWNETKGIVTEPMDFSGDVKYD